MKNIAERPLHTSVLAGGKIPVFVPYIGVDTLKHVTDALDVGWLGLGAITKDFEERIGAYLGGCISLCSPPAPARATR
jgi:dTDP-4-amino-4,6-dideoxygalactose transaminase